MGIKDDLAGSVAIFVWVLLYCGVSTVAAGAQGGYRYTIIAGPAQSIDGFSPSSLNENNEVVYADNANGTISTSTDTLVRVDDVIGGERLSAIPAGSGTSFNDDGLAVFRARYDAGSGLDLDAIFTPTDLVAMQWGSVGGTTVGSLSTPSVNNSGQIVFSATICPNLSCVASGIFSASVELLRTPYSDGFVEVTSVSDPVINDDGQIAFYGYAYLADSSAVYRGQPGVTLWRIVHTGEALAPGVVLDNPRGIVEGLDLNEHGDIATCWNTESGDWVVLKNGELVAKAGDTIDGIILTEVPNHRPALNDDGVVAFMARHAGGSGVFTQTDLVLTEGQTIGGQTILSIRQPAINESGTIAVHVYFESGFYGLVLATPLASNHFVQMKTGSSVALRQSVDVPSEPFALRVDHRFATTTGQLNLQLGEISLGSVGAPGTVAEEFERSVFQVSGAVLGDSDVTLELELEGPGGSILEVDNVFFPDLVNGTFQAGSLTGWETVISGAGSVELLPEPSATLSSLVCVLALAVLSGRVRRPGRARLA